MNDIAYINLHVQRMTLVKFESDMKEINRITCSGVLLYCFECQHLPSLLQKYQIQRRHPHLDRNIKSTHHDHRPSLFLSRARFLYVHILHVLCRNGWTHHDKMTRHGIRYEPNRSPKFLKNKKKKHLFITENMCTCREIAKTLFSQENWAVVISAVPCWARMSLSFH